MLTMVAFASNSLFCRLALGRGSIEAAPFTLIRLAAGTVILLLILALRGKPLRPLLRPDVRGALALFVYAAAFSFAYRELAAGTGALLLFGAVQATMIGTGLYRGERPTAMEGMGFLAALAGLVWLVAPGVTAAPWRGAGLMLMAGVAWGVYSLHGRRAQEPLTATTRNFLWAVPPAILLLALFPDETHFNSVGLSWALLSGALASGGGYALWYTVLPRLSATRAATVQLTVPVIAALGGVAFLTESVSSRLLFAAVFVLGGVALAILGRRR